MQAGAGRCSSWGPALRLDLSSRPRLLAFSQAVLMYALAVAVIVGLSPAGIIGGGVWPKLLFLLRMVVLIGVATWLLRTRGLGWAQVGLRRPSWLRFALAIPLGLVACAACAGAVRLTQHAVGADTGPGGDYAAFRPLEHHLGEYLFWLLPASWGSAAFGEEMLFRGFLLDGFRRAFGEGRAALVGAILVQALLFGSLHLYQGINGATVATTLGVVLGFVWWASGRNLWAGIVIHGVLDSSAMTVIYLGLLPH